MNQRSFSELEFDTKKRKTRRELLLDKLDVLTTRKSLIGESQIREVLKDVKDDRSVTYDYR